MPSNPSPNQPLGPLSVGNVVSAALRIYRDKFKPYFKIAFQGYLWSFIPIYGWAKLTSTFGLLSRLAFGEVSEKPEIIRDAERDLKPIFWDFFVVGLLVSLILISAMIGGLIAGSIFIGILSAIFKEGALLAIPVIAGIITFIAWILMLIWLGSRLFLVEVSMAIEEVSPTVAIKRSWELTKSSVGRIQMIIFVAVLISLPISLVVQIISQILQIVFARLITDNPILFVPYLILLIGISIAGGALLAPFWQALKGVIYYDLRTRREGLGLGLSDRLRKN